MLGGTRDPCQWYYAEFALQKANRYHTGTRSYRWVLHSSGNLPVATFLSPGRPSH